MKCKEIIECECGCFIQKWHLSRHMKTVKHIELLNTKTKPGKIKKPNKNTG
jgi:hypothetical protein